MDDVLRPTQKIFDMRITLGSILQIAVLLGTIILFWANLESRIVALEEMGSVREQQMATIENKLDIVDMKVSELSYQLGQVEQQLKDQQHQR